MDEIDALFKQFPVDADFDAGMGKLMDMMRDRFVRLLRLERFQDILHGAMGLNEECLDHAFCVVINEVGISKKMFNKCLYQELKFVNDALRFPFIKQWVNYF